MTMTYRSNVLALFAAAPLLAACPIDGNLGDAGDSANDEGAEGNGDAADADAGDDGGAETGGSGSGGGDAGDAGDAGEGGSDGGGCTEDQCGPAPGAPNYLCDDGVTWAGPGACELQDDGTCGWTWVECPACCYDPPPTCVEGATCCGDGTWACNEGDGSSTCDANGGVGVECSCCEPGGGDDLGCIEGASCCGDGTWACNDDGGNSTCDAPGVECSGGGGTCQEDGASCASGETCCDGLICCTGIPVPPGDEYCSMNCPISDRNRKENFELVDHQAVLDQLLAIPLTTWNYKFEDASIRHIGPMAQDFAAAFMVGSTDKRIYTIDADGVAFASIKALHSELETLRAEKAELESTLAKMSARLDALEAK